MQVALPVFIMLIGVAAIVGWCLEISPLYRVLDDWVTMKPVTSLATIMVGGGLLVHRIPYLREAAEFTLSALLSYMVVTYFLGASEIVASIDDERLTPKLGVPSAATIVVVLLCIVGLTKMRPIWWHLVGAIGCVPLIGYVLALCNVDAVWLMYYHEPWSTAMAFPTAVAFTLAGAIGVRISRKTRAEG